MAFWKNFEIDCTAYLNNTFRDYATFTHQGGEDSTVPDILVETQSGKSFYIEAKHCPAQCGQFVLLPNWDTRTFEYSHQNANHINKYSKMIMDYMNHSFDKYIESGTAGKDIDMDNNSQFFSNWIIQTYQDKAVKFIITNDYTIVPLERFLNYFDVTGKYRIKRSGSRNVGKSCIGLVIDYISTHDYIINDTRIEGDKLFVSSSQNIHDQRFILHGIEYMFSLRGHEYELRKLSNTYNANVIFSIRKKNISPGLSKEAFIEELK